MKTLYASVAAMLLVAGVAFGLPAYLPEARPADVPPELLGRLKTQAMVGSDKPALWIAVKSAHVADDTPAGVAGVVELRTLFGFNWATITLYDDGTKQGKYEDHRQWGAIGMFVAVELMFGVLVVWSVLR